MGGRGVWSADEVPARLRGGVVGATVRVLGAWTGWDGLNGWGRGGDVGHGYFSWLDEEFENATIGLVTSLAFVKLRCECDALTVWPLKVLTTAFAASLLSITTSAMTVGLVAISVVFNTLPTTVIIALSISAADVPGAKFAAWTIAGPAMPLMENPPFGLRMFTWELRFGVEAVFNADARRAARMFWFFGLGPVGIGEEAVWECRSWVQALSMLEVAAGALRA